jgi:SAM-dependent methyltransferase
MDDGKSTGLSFHATDAWQADLSADQTSRLAGYLQEIADDPFLRQIAVRSLELMSLAPGQTVLDVGCGAGVFLPALAHAVAPDGHVVGVDYSAALLEEARTRAESAGVLQQITLREADATQLPFADASFDAAHVERVLLHVDDPDAVLREMRRVVRPGGCVVAVEPDYGGVRIDHPDQEAVRLMIQATARQLLHPEIGLELRRRMTGAGLAEARFEVYVETEHNLHPASLAALERGAADAVSAGALTEKRAQSLIDDLKQAGARGTYVSYDHMVIASARA